MLAPYYYSLMTSLSVSSLSLVAIPVYAKQSISFFETGSCGRLDITIGPKQAMGKTVENLMVRIHMPKAVSSANLTATQGNYTFDLVTKVTKCSKDDAREGWIHCMILNIVYGLNNVFLTYLTL